MFWEISSALGWLVVRRPLHRLRNLAAEDTDDEIRQKILSYPILNPRVLAANCLLDHTNSRSLFTTGQITGDLGTLDKLPVEVNQKMLGFLDCGSLLVFRRVNRRAMAVVDDMPEWTKVIFYLLIHS